MDVKTSILTLADRPAASLVSLAQLAERSGYGAFWIADERFFREVYASLAAVALSTTRIKLGTGVTDPYSRHPALTAMAIATVDEIAGGRAMLGLGAGVSGFRELGVDARRSAVAMRESVELIRRLLRGETVAVKGEVVAFTGGRLDFTPARAEVPIYVASQRRAGCRVAGRLADGAIMQGCVAEPLVRFFRDTVHAAAREAGRDPAAIDLVARLNVCIADDRRAARDLMRPTIVRSLVSQRPAFFTFVTAGCRIPESLARKVMALSYTHDPAPLRALAAEVPDELVDAVTLTGSPVEVAREVARLARAGIAHLMIYPFAVDGQVETTIERFQTDVMPEVRAAGA